MGRQFNHFSFTGKNSGSASESSLTGSIEVIDTIVYYHNISLLHSPIVPDSVLLHGLQIEHCNLHWPHTGHGEQHHLVTPKISSEQQVKILSIRQRRGPPSGLLHLLLNLNTIMTWQWPKLALQDQLVVVYHEEDHHSPEVMVWKIGGLPRSGSAHQHRLFNSSEQTIPSPIDLQVK